VGKLERAVNRYLWTTFLALLWCLPLLAAQADYAKRIAPLIDPSKLTTLGPRGANQRVQKAVYWLAEAQQAGQKPDKVLDGALRSVGMTQGAAELSKEALLRNLDIADKLGCLDAEGMAEMRQGKAATVRRDPYKGDHLSVDHIVPRAAAPELDNVIANLALMPLRMNAEKNDKIGNGQRDMAKKCFHAGLLSDKGLKAVVAEQKRQAQLRFCGQGWRPSMAAEGRLDSSLTCLRPDVACPTQP
jgi:hypothetical protein